MQKRAWILSLFLIVGLSSNTDGQITLSPETGLSYWPISTIPITHEGIYTSKRIDYLIGMSGTVPIHEKWSLNMRLSFVNRETLQWDESEFSGPLFHELKHSDINIDLSIGYKVHKKISLWVGPSIVRKLNSTLLVVP